MKKIALLLSVFSFWACEEEIEFTIPNPGNKIVVDCKLIADQRVSALVSESTYSLSNAEPQEREDFSVILYGEDGFVETLRPTSSAQVNRLYYLSDRAIPQGTNYRLEVIDPQGVLYPVEAEAYVPRPVSANYIRWNNNLKEVTFSLNPNLKAYYKITLRQGPALTGDPIFISSISPGLEFLGFDFADFDDDFNRGFGQSAYLNANEIANYNTFTLRIEDTSLNLSQGFYIALERINEGYYRFEKTKTAQGFTDGFFSEPVQIYSNVKNGYGAVVTSAPSFNFVNTQ